MFKDFGSFYHCCVRHEVHFNQLYRHVFRRHRNVSLTPDFLWPVIHGVVASGHDVCQSLLHCTSVSYKRLSLPYVLIVLWLLRDQIALWCYDNPALSGTRPSAVALLTSKWNRFMLKCIYLAIDVLVNFLTRCRHSEWAPKIMLFDTILYTIF